MSYQDNGARVGLVVLAIVAGLVLVGFLTWTNNTRQRQEDALYALDQRQKAEQDAARARALEKTAVPREVPAAAQAEATPLEFPSEEAKPQAEEPEAPKGSQRAFVLQHGWQGNLSELNDLLKNGWRIKQTCAMSPTSDGRTSNCLVVLEKEN
ncbi:MAG: hypothetical protein KIS92_17545 [Planctomycetota bacterium]|nr:hypothetical protein [Planctomycetota bacterium]